MALSRKLNKKHAFNPAEINAAPTAGGVYILYKDQEIVFIGQAEDSIRKELQSHYLGDVGRNTQVVSHYSFEPSRDPAKKEDKLLEWHKAEFFRLPRHNDRYG